MRAAFAIPPRWSDEQLDGDIARGVEGFRRERFEEPNERYAACADEYLATVEELIELTVDLTQVRERAVEVVGDPRLLHALRFLTGPFISEDDLTVVARTGLSPQALRRDPDAARRIVDTVMAGLDRRRVPWLEGGWVPSQDERAAAALASASLMATEAVKTWRRNEAKSLQESAVARALEGAGFRRVAPRGAVRTLEEAPGPGQYCREIVFGDRKADLLVGLWDRRRMPVECKVSNSRTNSIKRVNNDAAVKAETWLQDFGRSQVVPAAVLSGVFTRGTLESAQSRGLTLFWAHRLDDLTDWIRGTGS